MANLDVTDLEPSEDLATAEAIRAMARRPIERAPPGRRSLAVRLRGPEAELEAAYDRLSAAPDSEAPSRGAEWLLDNHHVVQRALRTVREEFSAGFERRLPRLSGVTTGSSNERAAGCTNSMRATSPASAHRFISFIAGGS